MNRRRNIPGKRPRWNSRWAIGRPTLTRNRPRREDRRAGLGRVSAGVLAATVGAARAAGQALAGANEAACTTGPMAPQEDAAARPCGGPAPAQVAAAKMKSSWKNATGKRSA